MTRRATFTQAELTRAARAAARLGMRVALVLTDAGARIELLPALDQTPTPAQDAGTGERTPAQW